VRPNLPLRDQHLQVGLKAGKILARILEQQFDEPSFACPEMPVNTAAGQSMQGGNRLLREKPFKFVAGHSVARSR
jgi:hypothetical protein